MILSYPKPIRLTSKQRKTLSEYLDYQIETAKNAREDLVNTWVEWLDLYNAASQYKIKTFPWWKASNLVIPVVAIAVDAIIPRLMNAYFSQKTFWTARALSGKWEQFRIPTERYLEWLQSHVVNLYSVCNDWVTEQVKMGTAFAKLTWVNQSYKIPMYGPNGEIVEREVKRHVGPKLVAIPIENMLFPYDAQDVQTARWVSEKTWVHWTWLKAQEKLGKIENLDKIKNHEESELSALQIKRLEDNDIDWTDVEDAPYQLDEVHMTYDLNEDGIPEEIVVLFHRKTKTILRCMYIWYQHCQRPYHCLKYFHKEFDLYGIGVCKMLKQFQEGTSTVINQTIDAQTAANAKMINSRPNVYRKGERIWPGKVKEMNDPATDVKEFSLSSPGPGNDRIISTLQGYNERRVGLSDYGLGRESSVAGSRATATLGLAIIQEGNKRFDMTIRDNRRAFSAVGNQILQLAQQFKPTGQIYNVLEEEAGSYIRAMYRFPPEYIQQVLDIEVTATSMQVSREVQMQELLQTMQMCMGYYQQFMQLAVTATSPQAPSALRASAMGMARGLSEAMERYLERNTAVSNAKSYMGNTKAIMQLLYQDVVGKNPMASQPPQGGQQPSGSQGTKGAPGGFTAPTGMGVS